MDDHLSISPLVDWAECMADDFLSSFFGKLLGQTYIREMIEAGCSEAKECERIKGNERLCGDRF